MEVMEMKLDKRFTFMLDMETLNELKKLASVNRQAVGTFVRTLVLKEIKKNKKDGTI